MTTDIRHPSAVAALWLFISTTARAQPPDDPAHMAIPAGGAKPAAAQPAPIDPDPKRPVDPAQQVVYDLGQFVNSLNGRPIFPDHTFRYVAGERKGYYGAQEWGRFEGMLASREVQISKATVTKLNGDSAEVTVSENLVPPEDAPQAVKTSQEDLEMKLSANDIDPRFTLWKIVPPDVEPPMGPDNFPVHLLAYTAFHLVQRHPEIPLPPDEDSLGKLRKLANGTLQFMQDWNEELAFDDEGVMEALWPYVHSESSIFFIPGSRERYAFNDHLAGLRMTQFSDYARTVLFYEGDGDTPIYRYGGKAALAFLDGHVALVTPDQAKEVIWKPVFTAQ